MPSIKNKVAGLPINAFFKEEEKEGKAPKSTEEQPSPEQSEESPKKAQGESTGTDKTPSGTEGDVTGTDKAFRGTEGDATGTDEKPDEKTQRIVDQPVPADKEKPKESGEKETEDKSQASDQIEELDLGDLIRDGEEKQPEEQAQGYAEYQKKVLKELFGEDEGVQDLASAKKRLEDIRNAQARVQMPNLGDVEKMVVVAQKEALKNGEDPEQARQMIYDTFVRMPPDQVSDDVWAQQYLHDMDKDLQQLHQEGKGEEYAERMQELVGEFQKMQSFEQGERIKKTKDAYMQSYQQQKDALLKKYDDVVSSVDQAVQRAASGTVKALKELEATPEQIEFEGIPVKNTEPLKQYVGQALSSGDPMKLVEAAFGSPEKDPKAFVQNLFDVILRYSPALDTWRQKQQGRLTQKERDIRKKALEDVALSDVEHKKGSGGSSSNATATGIRASSKRPRIPVDKALANMDGSRLVGGDNS